MMTNQTRYYTIKSDTTIIQLKLYHDLNLNNKIKSSACFYNKNNNIILNRLSEPYLKSGPMIFGRFNNDPNLIRLYLNL